MTTFKVYEIYNEIGVPYYVGCTKDITNRKSQHKINGRYGTFHIVREFPEDKLDVALYYEAYLKYVHGLNDYIKFEGGSYKSKIKGGKKAGRLNGIKNSKPIKVYTKSGQFVGEYPSQMEAARQLENSLGCRVDVGGIAMVVRGKCKTYKGHIFKRS